MAEFMSTQKYSDTDFDVNSKREYWWYVQEIKMKNLRALLKREKLRQEDLAEKIGVTQSFISKLVRLEQEGDISLAVAIAGALGVTFQELTGTPLPTSPSAPLEIRVTWDTGKLAGMDPPPDERFLPVPVLDPDLIKIVGGSPLVDTREQISDVALIHRRVLGRKSPKGLYCLFVDGTSMEPVLRAGAIVCVDTNIKPGRKPPKDSIWSVRDGGTSGPIIKHIKFSDGELWLVSANPLEEEPMKKAKEGYEIHGRVVWVWQSLT